MPQKIALGLFAHLMEPAQSELNSEEVEPNLFRIARASERAHKPIVLEAGN